MARLNVEKQKQLEPKRIEFAKTELEKLGLKIIETDSTKIQFEFKSNVITLYPYSGWHTGKGIKDGRGLQNLLKQINQNGTV